MIRSFNIWRLNEDLESNKFKDLQDIVSWIRDHVGFDIDDELRYSKNGLYYVTDHRLGHGSCKYDMDVEKISSVEDAELEDINLMDLLGLDAYKFVITSAKCDVRYSDDIYRFENPESVYLMAEIKSVSAIETKSQLKDFMDNCEAHHVDWEKMMDGYTQDGLIVSNIEIDFD
jgi:hypothetical protein